MKTLTMLKTLPLIGLLGLGLAFTPMTSMAGDDDRGRGKDRVYQKHDGGKGKHRVESRSHRRDKGHYVRDHGHKKGFAKGYRKAQKHAYSGHHRKGHKHHGHKQHVHAYRDHGHRHVDTVVVHDRYDYDPFRLMLGLHFDNIDIIYRDF